MGLFAETVLLIFFVFFKGLTLKNGLPLLKHYFQKVLMLVSG